KTEFRNAWPCCPLPQGQTYKNVFEFYIYPQLNDGEYTVEISVDYLNNVFTVYSTSKTVTAKLNVERTIAKWYLTNMNVSTTNYNDKETINSLIIEYTLSIDYPLKIEQELTWLDLYYLSDRSKFDENFSIKIGEINHKILVNQKNIYKLNVKQKFDLDNSINGKNYIYIFIDAKNLNEKIIEYQLPVVKSIQLDEIPSILNIIEMKMSNIIEMNANGYTVLLTWKIKNVGKKEVQNPRFDFYAQPLSGSTFYLNTFKSEKNIRVNEEITENIKLLFGFLSIGKFKIIIKPINTIANKFSLSSNSINTTEIQIQQPKSVDLMVKSIIYSDKLQADKSDKCDNNFYFLNISYTVENIAYSMEKVTEWQDTINIICKQYGVVLNNKIIVVKTLRAFDSYSNWWQFSLSLITDYLSDCKIQIFVNSDNAAIELFNRDNNIKEHCCFFIPSKPDASFILTSLNYSNTEWMAGEAYKISYLIKNEGNSSTYSRNSWKD
ncbi:unnamed protein product, partial [Didymodactylos carnosus]